MTKVIVVHGENGESENCKLVLPAAGAEYIGLYNSSLNKVKNNFAPFKKNVSTVGSIALNTNDVTLKSQVNYLQTDIDETAEMTTFVVAKSSVLPPTIAESIAFMSNYKTPPKDGSSTSTINSYYLGINASGKIATVCSQGNNASDASGVGAISVAQNWTVGEYHLVAARITNTRIEHFDKTKNYHIYADLTKPRYLGLGKLRIGSSYSYYQGSANIAALIHFSRALSDTEIEQVSAWIRSYMSTKSISV